MGTRIIADCARTRGSAGLRLHIRALRPSVILEPVLLPAPTTRACACRREPMLDPATARPSATRARSFPGFPYHQVHREARRRRKHPPDRPVLMASATP